MFKKGYRNIQRYKEIGRVLVKYGFTFVVEKLNIEGIAYRIPITNPPDKIKHMSIGKRLRFSLEELGPTYVKLGQILSTRKDLFDKEIVDELSKLRDNVAPFDKETAKTIFKQEIGMSVEEAFLEFDDNVLAAASLGQVYRAKLKNNQSVIVKIQRPGVEQKIKSDLEIMHHIGKVLKDISKERNIDFNKIIDDFEKQLILELDYSVEAINTQKFKKMFEGSQTVYIPTIYDEFTTKKVIVQEEIKGVKLSDIKTIRDNKWDTTKIAEIGFKSLFKQIFEKGFFHADPHPGNIFVIDKDKICFIDFGMVGIIDQYTLANLNEIAVAAINRNIDKVIYILMEMNLISDDTNVFGLRQDLSYLMHYYYDIPLEKISIGNILNQVFGFLRTYNVTLDTSMVLLAKSIITLEGTARDLDPNFSISVAGKEFLKYYYLNKVNPVKVALNTKHDVDEFVWGMKVIPKQLRVILRNLEKNNLKIHVEEVKMPTIVKSINNFATQVSLSVVLAALLVGSSLVISSANLEKFHWIKLLAVTGYVTSVIVGILLIAKILRSQYKKK